VVVVVLAEILVEGPGEGAVSPPQYKTVTVKIKWQQLHARKNYKN